MKKCSIEQHYGIKGPHDTSKVICLTCWNGHLARCKEGEAKLRKALARIAGHTLDAPRTIIEMRLIAEEALSEPEVS
jgi:hypothetical protein